MYATASICTCRILILQHYVIEGRFHTLARNVGVFALANFATRFLGLLLLPFYARVLSPAEFGVSDIIVTLVGLAVPLLTGAVADASLRFALDTSEERDVIWAHGVLVSCVGFICIVAISPIGLLFTTTQAYVVHAVILAITSGAANFCVLFTKGRGRVGPVALSGVLNTVVVGGLSVLLLYNLGFGVGAYLNAMSAGYISVVVYLFWSEDYYAIPIRSSLRRAPGKWREMLAYSFAVVPTNVAWWVNHTSNRFFINSLLGPGEVGRFAAVSRMPSILNAIHGIFVQAWQLSAIAEFGDKAADKFFVSVHNFYVVVLALSGSILVALSYVLTNLLLPFEYVSAWPVLPLLFVSVVFGSLVGFYSSLYLASKRTVILLVATALGAMVTVLGNVFLVPRTGLVGSGIASVVAYFCVWLFLVVHSLRIRVWRIPLAAYVPSLIALVAQSVLQAFGGSVARSIEVQGGFVLLQFVLHRRSIGRVLEIVGSSLAIRR